MTEQDALQAVLARPDEDKPRLAYAEMLDQRGDVRGAFIRLQLQEANGEPPTAQSRLEGPADWLLLKNEYDWAKSLQGIVTSRAFHRGFVSWIALPARAFLEKAAGILASHPVQHISFSDAKPWLNDLLQSGFLSRMRSLSFDRCGLDSADLKLLSESPGLGELRWLSLTGNQITLPGAEALAKSTSLPRLRYVNFEGNPVDPGEQYANDQGIIVESWMPSSGQWLEEKYGPLPWLHVPAAATVNDIPPDRFIII
jgi:uncharacterized protein (TIGR02996 family)